MKFNQKKSIKNIVIIIYIVVALALSLLFIYKNSTSKLYVYNSENIEVINNDDGTKDFKYIETMLSAKKHYIDLAYISSTEAAMEVFVDNGNIESLVLPATASTGSLQTVEIKPVVPTDRMKIKIHASSDFEIIQTNLRSETSLYADNILYAVMCILSIPLFILWLNLFIKSDRKASHIILFAMYVMSVSVVLIRWNMIPFGADTRDHLQRIQGIMYGLNDGQTHVLIYPNMNNEYGQTGALYPSLFIYIPALLRLVNISLLTSYNMMIMIVNLATVAVMYHVSKLVFKDEKIALVATFIHVFDASRMLCYMSGSMLATGLAMVFTPLIIYGLYTIIVDENPKWQYLSFGLFGIVSSHVLQTVISVGVAILILIICAKKVNKKVIISLVKSGITFILISLGTIVPFIRFYLMGFSQDKLNLNEFIESQYDFEDFFINYGYAFMPVVISIISLATVIYVSKKTKNNITKRDYFFRVLFVVYLICMLMLSELFPWLYLQRFEIIKTFTNMVQYPMRILGSTSVIVAFLFAYAIEILHNYESVRFNSNSDSGVDIANINEYKKIKNIFKKENILILVMIIITLFGNKDGIQGYFEDEPLIYDEMTGYFNSRNNEDYLPVNTKSEYYSSDSGKVSNEEVVKSYSYEKSLTHVKYTYETTSEGEYAIFPLFYYDGYVAKDEYNNVYDVKKSDENKVMVTLKPSDEIKELNLYYKVSPIYVIIDVVCALIIILVIGYLIYQKKKINS